MLENLNLWLFEGGNHGRDTLFFICFWTYLANICLCLVVEAHICTPLLAFLTSFRRLMMSDE
ncbi:hypothetical protein [Nostoc sp.]|uniref:hypothetical protein n=1 Tax=Nostoc sp. TaxID=1180 RepID=UPI002FEE9A41